MPTLRRLTLAATLCTLALAAPLRAAEPGTTVIFDTPWAPGDESRAGAAEFAILLRVAQLRQNHSHTGIVAVGNRHGLLQPATEEALARAALMGVVVVRLADAIKPPALPDDLFVEVGAQPAYAVEKTLADCLKRFGPVPAAANPARPTPQETAAIRQVLARYQLAFDTAASMTKSGALAMGPRNDYEN